MYDVTIYFRLQKRNIYCNFTFYKVDSEKSKTIFFNRKGRLNL